MRSAFRLWFCLTFRFHVFEIFGFAFRFQNHLCYGLIKTLNVCLMIVSDEQLLYLANQYFERTFSIMDFLFFLFLLFRNTDYWRNVRQNKIREMVITDTFHFNNSPLSDVSRIIMNYYLTFETKDVFIAHFWRSWTL